MPGRSQRLTDPCLCGHRGGDHKALDAGTHISLGSCTKCDCPGFRGDRRRRDPAKPNHHAHGAYSKRSWTP